MEEKIRAILSSIGLSKNESLVYVDLLKHSKSTALEVAKRTSIHRTNVYDALRNLQEKGFISEVIEEKGRSFAAGDPHKVINYVMQQKAEIESILPYFKSIASEKEEVSSLAMSKGTFALREALTKMLEQNKPIYAYGASKELRDAFGHGFLKEFHAKRMKKKIPMYHIYNKNYTERINQLNRMKYTFARHLSDDYSTLVSTNICGDTVVLVVFAAPVYILTIKNAKIAETYQKYFELLWKQAKSNSK